MNCLRKSRRKLRSSKLIGNLLLLGLFGGAVWGYSECWLADDNYTLTRVIKEQESLPMTETEQPGFMVTVQLKSGELLTQELEEYVINVVAAEMPADFPQEALKAQAVAARSYLKHYLTNNAYIPAGTIAQDWLSLEEQKKRWGDNYPIYHEKIVQAVSATKGEVLYWQDNVITAAYHASCGGIKTAAAEEIWGGAVSYLVSVPCPHGEEKYSKVEHIFTKKEIAQALNLPQVKSIKVLSLTASDRVKEVKVDEQIYEAAKIRTALALPSTIFTVKNKGDEIIITTSGSGHGVGMCQYGARYYANQKWDYKRILAHFYPETVLKKV